VEVGKKKPKHPAGEPMDETPLIESLWKKKSGSVTARKDLDLVLSAATYLPLQFWRKNFLFFGAKDKKLLLLTGGAFPAKLEPDKARPVFCLAVLPDGAGCKACPCSTKPPFSKGPHRFIPEGCTLRHTGKRTDKRSFLVEKFSFPVPRSLSADLRFKGEVPSECLITS
jgi:hypothetical protein